MSERYDVEAAALDLVASDGTFADARNALERAYLAGRESMRAAAAKKLHFDASTFAIGVDTVEEWILAIPLDDSKETPCP